MIRLVPYFLVVIVVVAALMVASKYSSDEVPPPSFAAAVTSDSGRTFYVDQTSGHDRNDGLSVDSPWASLVAIRRTPLAPGDRVLLHRGQVWRETLTVAQSGSASAPITIGAYGVGDPPKLRGSDITDDAAQWREEDAGRWYLTGVTEDPGFLLVDGIYPTRCGTREALTALWDFYYDSTRRRVYVRADENPALQSTSIEIPRREFVIGPLEVHHIQLEDLDIGHGRSMSLLAWDSDYLTVTRCRFTGSGENHIQFQQGSNHGTVTESHFDDWNILHRRAYAIQVIEKESGPIDIADCTFTATRTGGGEDHAAIMNDYNGWIRSVRNCQFTGNGGALADEGVVIWRPAATADTVLIEGNSFVELGGSAIMIQELEHYGAKPDIRVVRNRIQNVCRGNDLDKEALRARQFSEASSVLIAYNLIDGTAPGTHPHAGIGVQDAIGLRIINNVVSQSDLGISLKHNVSQATVHNNIMFNNRGAGWSAGSTVRDLEFDYNCLHGNGSTDETQVVPGAHTIVADPQLREDFQLMPDSPCIDAGILVPELTRDFTDGEVPQGATSDIGAIEYTP